MADFNGHILQAEENLSFLRKIDVIEGSWNWKVTVTFYCALHLMNAHICSKIGQTEYLTHRRVDDYISPEETMSPARLPEDIYVRYKSLYNLSRRARYLVHEKTKDSSKPFLTYDKHYCKALSHLDIIMEYMKGNYNLSFINISTSCIEVKGKSMSNFTYSKLAV